MTHHFQPSAVGCVFKGLKYVFLVPVKAKVTCSESTMTVEVDKSSFFGFQEDHLRLSDPTNTACSLERYSNSTHIIGVIPPQLLWHSDRGNQQSFVPSQTRFCQLFINQQYKNQIHDHSLCRKTTTTSSLRMKSPQWRTTAAR